MYFLLCFRGNSINLHTLRSSICGFSISACHSRLSDENCWMGLLSSPGLTHIPLRCQKRLKKPLKNAKGDHSEHRCFPEFQPIDLFLSGSVAWTIYQVQGTSTEEGKGQSKKNYNGEFKAIKYYLPQFSQTFLQIQQLPQAWRFLTHFTKRCLEFSR